MEIGEIMEISFKYIGFFLEWMTESLNKCIKILTLCICSWERYSIFCVIFKASRSFLLVISYSLIKRNMYKNLNRCKRYNIGWLLWSLSRSNEKKINQGNTFCFIKRDHPCYKVRETLKKMWLMSYKFVWHKSMVRWNKQYIL